MGRPLTGERPGPKQNPVNEHLKDILAEPQNRLANWDGLFDAFHSLKEDGISPRILDAIEDLIERNADVEALNVRNIIENFSDEIRTHYCLLTCGSDDFDNTLSKQTGILDKTVLKLQKIKQTPESRNMILRLDQLREKLVFGARKAILSDEDVSSLYSEVGVIHEAEINFIQKYLSSRIDVAKTKGRMLANTRGKAVNWGFASRDEEILQHAADDTLQRVFRFKTKAYGAYNEFLPEGRKKAFLRTMFSQIASVLFKRAAKKGLLDPKFIHRPVAKQSFVKPIAMKTIFYNGKTITCPVYAAPPVENIWVVTPSKNKNRDRRHDENL